MSGRIGFFGLTQVASRWTWAAAIEEVERRQRLMARKFGYAPHFVVRRRITGGHPVWTLSVRKARS